MAKKNKKTARIKVTRTEEVKSKFVQDLSAQLRLGESYISLVLGAVVVFGLFVIFFYMQCQAPNMSWNPEKH